MIFLSPSRKILGYCLYEVTSASRYFPIESSYHPALYNLCTGSLVKQVTRKEGNLWAEVSHEWTGFYLVARDSQKFAYK
jgi:hypothetical protein